ncbi:3-isopropylmalate dehydrogenase [Liquorilactobacillus ghanensis DSM 18630]|uniref:3-isopropylmalate dehydrogenase n=1 Tax=Liquorilactobacillus ghanensis DSM 18630 TaxID=1423750 RepID=A0A0R1VJV5_9LACO|nr:3-isopropylmalate dehydrogenase [Liquorilactobacillus ghanensis DSM 18630]
MLVAFKIAAIEGDGIGPEIMAATKDVINQVAAVFNLNIEIDDVCAGGQSIDRYNTPLTEENFQKCKDSNAILLANIGAPQYDNLPIEQRPERVMYRLRGELGLEVNVRPIFIPSSLRSCSPLKDEIVDEGFDVVVIRDVIGGELPSPKYRGKGSGGEEAYDKDYYNEKIVQRVANWAKKYAKLRKNNVVSLDKANGLASSELWRKIMVRELTAAKVDINSILVDSGVQTFTKGVAAFDVIVAPNLFGDIVADELTGLSGVGNLLPDATMGQGTFGMYEPNQLHNMNQKIVGKNIANPLGLIMAVSMMMEQSLELPKAAKVIRQAVMNVVNRGYVPADLKTSETKMVLGTREVTKMVCNEIKELS